MQVTVAKYAGFCGGVARAIKLAGEAAAAGPVYMLGDIVHNEYIVNELRDSGVRIVSSLDEILSESRVLFRAHGTPVTIQKMARDRHLEIIDATCPLVLEIHRIAAELADENRQIIVIGDHGHDEVEAICSVVPNPVVLATPAEAGLFSPDKRIGIVVQSTQARDNVQEIVKILAGKTTDMRFINTICAPTRNRQQEIRALAKSHDLVLVIGSRISANSLRLKTVAQEINPQTYQINSVSDIDFKWFSGVNSVAIAAGASTPEIIIKEVENFVKNIKIT